MNRRIVLVGIGALSGGVLFSRRAGAWVPPAEFLIGRMADKRKGMKSVQASGIRTYLGRSYEGGKQDVSETLYSGADGAYRIERKTPKGEYIEVSDGKRRVIVNDGKAGAIENDSRPLERLLLFGASKDELLRAIAAYGINKEVSSMGRIGDRVAWIIGGRAGDTISPQLWIDKDRSLPLMLEDPRQKRTVKFDGWGESAGAGVLPIRVSWLKGGEAEQELKIEEAKSNPKLSADLFKPDAPIPPPTPTPTAKPSPTPTPATPKPGTAPAKPKPTPKKR